jgi:hypothetical protein
VRYFRKKIECGAARGDTIKPGQRPSQSTGHDDNFVFLVADGGKQLHE